MRPPLWALPAAAGFVALLLVCALPLYERDRREEPGRWQRIVERSIEPPPGQSEVDERGRRASMVVGVGTSMLNSAVSFNGDLDRLALECGRRPVHFREFCRPGWNWDAGPLRKGACDARPQVLLVESNLIFLRKPPSGASACRP